MATETPQMWDVINKMNDELAEVQDENERLKKSLEEERKEHHKNVIDLHIFDQLGKVIFSDDDLENAMYSIYNRGGGVLTKEEKSRAMELWYRYSEWEGPYPIKDYTMTEEEFIKYLKDRGEDEDDDEDFYFDEDGEILFHICLDNDISYFNCLWDTNLYYFEQLPI
jgi:hypothetical protein